MIKGKTDMASFGWHSSRVHEVERTLIDYLDICRRHHLLIIGLSVGLAGLAAVWSTLQTPIYESRATVVIDQPVPGSLEKDKSTSYPDFNPDYFQTHFELMKSRYILQKTADRLRIYERPEYAKSLSSRQLSRGDTQAQAQMSGEHSLSAEDQDLLLKEFSRDIEVMPIRGARLAHIIAHSSDSRFAAVAANALANAYIERTQDISANSRETSAQWLTTHLDELRDKVEASQQALYAFRSKHGLIDGRDRQAVASQKVGELESELVRAEMKKADAQARFQQIQSVLQGHDLQKREVDWSNMDASTEVLSSPLIQNLRTHEIKVSGEVAELSDKYGPLHPKLARSKAELQELRERIRLEVQKIFDSMKLDYEAALVRERMIKDAVSRHKQEKLGHEQFEIERGILEREAESSQHMYDVFLKLTKEAAIMTGMRSATVYLADPAVPSAFPVKPRKVLNTVMGLLIGLMAGIAFVMIHDAGSRTLRVPQDVERYIPSVSLLGVMPRLSRAETTKGPVLLPGPSQGPVAESVRIIRTSLLLSHTNHLPPRVLITSPGESEGKTTLSVNLAMALAQMEDTKVMLIDGDLRRPTHHKIFGIQKKGTAPKGLVDYLSGGEDKKDIVYPTEFSNLKLIPRGSAPSHPSELLYSKNLMKLFSWCQEEGYLVIVDGAPVLPVTDSVVLASRVDGIMMVVSAGQTTRECANLALQRLVAAGGKVLGIVMQKAPVSEIPYYYSYYSVKD